MAAGIAESSKSSKWKTAVGISNWLENVKRTRKLRDSNDVYIKSDVDISINSEIAN